ncbi:unnamed protein product [Vitrella brassicaformis CCMP3155]|uniref:NodB homology domain-containing protein n=1 Tax=Vitrella brassicaformis (strain CCMP3155) TaxID=1169540 RepID=A0A0G4EDI0_VITBC|nr:unnamed protein product [Vitrella brassicaformis CCMP3155]|eukprot:CEL93430.1 unnamed protein product [Vitrella brassicaformis CCMP3155]
MRASGKNVTLSRHLQTSLTASREASHEGLTNCKQPGLFALTFDDAPTDNFERMLDVLKDHHVRATLFVVGEYLRDPESVSLLKRAEEEGHVIENHSWDHSRLSELSDDEIRRQIERTEKIFHEQLGHGSRYIRAPYGDCGNLIPIADEYELTVVGWSVDLDVKSKEDRGTVESRLSDAEDVTSSQICLMHDSTHMLETKSIDALPEIIQLVHDKGYKFVTLEECLKG